jgi:hypothetical protein
VTLVGAGVRPTVVLGARRKQSAPPVEWYANAPHPWSLSHAAQHSSSEATEMGDGCLALRLHAAVELMPTASPLRTDSQTASNRG